jgi:hypothetical protein
MLFAELHRKLSPESPDLERQEDILTSTVFGTLIVGGQWSLLRDWLSEARDRDGKTLELPDAGEVRYWFWPRLAAAEPDVLLLFEDVLVIVEAKYLSGKSGSASTEGDEPADQLEREWRSCDPSLDACTAYPATLREAVQRGGANRALIYLVRQPTSQKTRRELEASRKQIGDRAALYSLGWSQLAALLDAHSSLGAMGWSVALRELLERRGFTAFNGFSRALTSDLAVVRRAALWQFRGTSKAAVTIDFPGAMTRVARQSVRRLARSASLWRKSRRASGRGLRWARVINSESVSLVKRLVRRDRAPTSPWQRLVSRRQIDLVRRLAASSRKGADDE